MQYYSPYDQYGRGPYRQMFHDICPAGGNRTVYYACTSAAVDQGIIDHMIISDPSSPPEDIPTIQWQATAGHISEFACFARIAHAQNVQIVQQQMMQYQAQYMQAQQYYALQQQLMEQQMQAMKAHYYAQTQGSSRSVAHSSGGAQYAGSSDRSDPPVPSRSVRTTKPRVLTKYAAKSQASNHGTSVYSEVSPSVDAWPGDQHPRIMVYKYRDSILNPPQPPPVGIFGKLKRSITKHRYGQRP